MRYLAAMSKISVEIQRERIPNLLQQVNLWEHQKTKVRKLSGRMKRRLGIAQALLNNPKALIVVEPTVGLDPEERLRFYNLLDEFSSDRVVIVSSHIVADIEKVFELMIPKNKLAAAKQDYYILSSQGHLSDIKIRILADSVPAAGCPASCVPTVEDGYMELLRLLEKGVKI